MKDNQFDKMKKAAPFLVVLPIAILSIHSNGFWGDETCRLWHPQYTLAEYIDRAVGFGQIGYLGYMGLWGRILGMSEVVARYSNIPFALLAVWFVLKILKKIKLPTWYFVFFFIHAMFTYYMNEVTPYILLYMLSLAFVYYVFFAEEDFNTPKNIVRINIIFLIGVFCHFIFGFIYVIYVCKCFLEWKKGRCLIRNHLKWLAVFGVAYVPLLIVILYGLTSKEHIRGAYGIQSIISIFYGFAGFAGMALSRNDLRAGKFSNLTVAQLVGALVLAALYLLIIVLARKSIFKILKKYYMLWIAALSYLIFANVVSAIIHFRLWDRHAMVIFPIWIILSCLLIEAIPKWKNVIIIGFLALMLYSSCNLRFNYYYFCDDFKGVYQEIQRYIEEEKVDIIYTYMEDSTGFYNLSELKTGTDIQIETIPTGESMQELREKVKTRTSEEKVIIILAEKSSSKAEYEYLDEFADFVNMEYNSYKILGFN